MSQASRRDNFDPGLEWPETGTATSLWSTRGSENNRWKLGGRAALLAAASEVATASAPIATGAEAQATQ
jgi:hypothetical protein